MIKKKICMIATILAIGALCCFLLRNVQPMELHPNFFVSFIGFYMIYSILTKKT